MTMPNGWMAAGVAGENVEQGEAWNAYLFWVGIAGKADFDEGMRRAGNSEPFVAGYHAAERATVAERDDALTVRDRALQEVVDLEQAVERLEADLDAARAQAAALRAVIVEAQERADPDYLHRRDRANANRMHVTLFHGYAQQLRDVQDFLGAALSAQPQDGEAGRCGRDNHPDLPRLDIVCPKHDGEAGRG